MAACAAAWARRGALLEVAWLAIMLAPAANALSESKLWDFDKYRIFLASCVLVACLRALLARRAFFLATWPIAFIGTLCVGASHRGLDLLALTLQWRSYSSLELEFVARLCAIDVAQAAVALVLACLVVYRYAPYPEPGRRTRLAVLACAAASCFALPPATWLRAWPANALLVATSTASGSRAIAQYLFPFTSSINPRDPKASWHGARVPGAPASETVVFVIGETVRADYLHECDGPERVRPVAKGALVACDVTSGTDATITSVPLLVSREMPGHASRVSDDATFLRALAEAGYETHWFDLQGRVVAWPDAQRMLFPAPRGGDDIPKLVPPLVGALGGPAPLKAVVLHPNNAHEPYCTRYDPAHAPYGVDCKPLHGAPVAANIGDVRIEYANAVDASVGFVNRVIEELEKRPEPAFLIFSPDHGENLLDDGREIYSHALRRPSRWDTQVPAIFWANAAWRTTHATRWRRLEAQIHAPLMHADLVPTFLDAAGVRYDEPRTTVVDLLAQPVPARQRVVQHTFGEVIEWQALTADAREAGPGPRTVAARPAATVAQAR
jgi:glucan phosphoethanolaminetransferase (alkaline phosphatase superfamily)